MERIYLIEDINELKYVGRTKNKLNQRLIEHKSDKKRNRGCSSKELDLENCEITCLDIADCEEEARELEEFYINSIDCVNHLKLNFDIKKYMDKYNEENREKINAKQREYNKKKKNQTHS